MFEEPKSREGVVILPMQVEEKKNYVKTWLVTLVFKHFKLWQATHIFFLIRRCDEETLQQKDSAWSIIYLRLVQVVFP